MTNEQIYAAVSLAVAFGALLAWLNLWYRRERSKMTQTERDQEDYRIGGDW